jgi:long-chain fatty acid transport protein
MEKKSKKNFVFFFLKTYNYKESVKLLIKHNGGCMKHSMKGLFVVLCVVFFSFSLFANGLNLNSIGSRASSMGTAFIGLSDDFSAVFFNPAGLTQMENANFSLFGTVLLPTATYQLPIAGIDATTESEMYPSGAISYFKPVSDKLVLGISVYVPSGSGATWNGDDLANLTGGTAFVWESMIAVITAAPAVAYKITDTFSLGATLNINYGMLKTDRPVLPLGQYSENITGVAFGASFGAMFTPSKYFSVGASLRTSSKVKLSGDADMPGAAGLGLSATSEAEREATWPMVAGIGIAVRPTDKLTIVADAVWTQWSKLDSLPITYTDPAWQATFAPGSEIQLNWDDTWQFKFGIEYQVATSWFLRAGYYSDPTPGPVETQNILIPQTDFNAVTAGFGYRTKKMALDFAFEYVMGTDREVPLTVTEGMPGTHGLKVLVPNLTFTIFFGGE